MNTAFCKQYISLFHRWKNRLTPENFSDENFHVALKKFFLRCLTLQFCIENKWSDCTISPSHSSIYATTVLPLFTSHNLAQSPLFHMQYPELEEVPDQLLLDIFSSNGLFQRFSFCADEYAHKKSMEESVVRRFFRIDIGVI